MNDTEIEQLLERARGVAPRADAKSRLRSRVLTAAAASAAVTAAPQASAALLASGGKATFWLGIMGFVAGGAATSYLALASLTTASAPPASVGRATSAASILPAAPAAPGPVVPAAPASPARVASGVKPPASVAPSASEAAPPSIARETALITEAQRALQRGDAASALRWLERYTSEFPRGALQAEASAARAISWCTLGPRARARQVLDAFRQTYPSSPLSPRVSAACHEVEGHDDFELEPPPAATQSGERP